MIPSRRAALLAGLALLPLPALAQPEGRGQGQGGQGQGGQGQGRGGGPPDRDRGGGPQRGNGPGGGPGGRGGGPDLGAVELGIVRAWLGANPGFAAQPLPPGMRNRLAKGKPLPPGIARRALPPDLLGRLPARPGYEYVIIGAALVLIEIATGAVSGLLSDALLR